MTMDRGRAGVPDRAFTLTADGLRTLDEQRATRVHPRTDVLIGVPSEELPLSVVGTAVRITDHGEHGGVQMTCTVQMHGEPVPSTLVVHLPDEARTLIAQVLGGIRRPGSTTTRGADS